PGEPAHLPGQRRGGPYRRAARRRRQRAGLLSPDAAGSAGLALGADEALEVLQVIGHPDGDDRAQDGDHQVLELTGVAGLDGLPAREEEAEGERAADEDPVRDDDQRRPPGSVGPAHTTQPPSTQTTWPVM